MSTSRSVRTLNYKQKEDIYKALEQCHGKIQGKNSAADLLDLHPATLRSRMLVLGIDFKKNKK